jgi:hypothetical protein
LGVGFWRVKEGKERLWKMSTLVWEFKKNKERFWGVLGGLFYSILKFPQIGGFWRVNFIN